MPTAQEEKNSIAKQTGQLIKDAIKKFENDKSAKKGVEMLKSIEEGELNAKGELNTYRNTEMRSDPGKYAYHLGVRLHNLHNYYANKSSSKDSESVKEIKEIIKQATNVMRAFDDPTISTEDRIKTANSRLSGLGNKVATVQPQKEKSRLTLIQKVREIGNKMRKSNNKATAPEEGIEQKQVTQQHKDGKLDAAKRKVSNWFR